MMRKLSKNILFLVIGIIALTFFVGTAVADDDDDGVPFELLQMQILQLNERLDNMCSPGGLDVSTLYTNSCSDVYYCYCNDENDIAIGGYARCPGITELWTAGNSRITDPTGFYYANCSGDVPPVVVDVLCINVPGTGL